VILHLLSRESWVEAQAHGQLVAPSVATEGFAHCSTEHQIVDVANKYYRGTSNMVLLNIDPAKLASVVKFEPPAHLDGSPALPHEPLFPHIYGPINLDAIIDARSKMARSKPEEIQLLQRTKQTIDNAENLEEIIKSIDASTLPKDTKTSIQNMIKEIIKQKTGSIKGVFSPAITTFFSLYKELSDEQLVEGIVASRNYKVSGLVSPLKVAVKHILDNKKESLFSEAGLTNSLKNLIGALHIVTYQQVQKFNNILFANDASRKAVLYTFKDTDLTSNLTNVYNFLEKNNTSINVSIDKMYYSAGITLNV
jgi:uncharacterized protein (DUF952 family)